MGRKYDKADFDQDQRIAYVMCSRKRKLKSNEASKKAERYNQRKYLCPFCGGWHLTKLKGE